MMANTVAISGAFYASSASASCSGASSASFQQRPRWSKPQIKPLTSQVCAVRDEESLPKKKQKEKPPRIEDELFPETEGDDKVKSFLELKLQSSAPTVLRRHYEIMYLVHQDKVDELQDIIQKFTGFVLGKKGKVWRLNDWGMRRLAYKIKKTTRANYILMNIEMEGKYLNQLDTLMEKDERVIRHLIMKQDRAYTEDTIPPAEYVTDRTLREEQEAAEGSFYDEEDEEEEDVGS